MARSPADRARTRARALSDLAAEYLLGPIFQRPLSIAMPERLTTVVHVSDPHDVYIGRGRGPWGNPFRIGRDGTRDDVIRLFRSYLMARPDLVDKAKRELRGKRLGCFCKPRACHGDVLAALVNEDILKPGSEDPWRSS